MNSIKYLLKSGLAVSVALFSVCGAVWAGSITPGASPAVSGYTLEDIYNRLNTNVAAGTHSFAPITSPVGSFYTLSQIYGKIPTIDATKILTGTSYLGVAGTIAIKDNLIGTDGSLNFSIPDGYYSGKTAMASDTDLTVGNVKSGTNLFGIVGEFPSASNPLSGDTGAVDASASEIKNNYEAWSKSGNLITGTLLPSGGSAAISQVCNGASFFGAGQTNWNLQLGTLNIDPGTISASSTYCGIAGTMVANPVFGDNDSTKVLNTAINPGTYDVASCSSDYNTLNLSVGTVKNGIIFGNALTGQYPSDSYPLLGDTVAGDASATKILSGYEAWTKAGTMITGTIADCSSEGANGCYANSGYWTSAVGANVIGGAGMLTFNLPNGYYNSKTASAVDADLVAGNIRNGVNIFGVDGNSNVVDTASGDAAADDILSGKKAWVDGVEISGNVTAGANVTGGTLQMTIPDGIYSGSKTATASDGSLIASNIKSGTTIFGVLGNYSASYAWTKAGAGSWEGVNDNLDWAVEIGDTNWWVSQTYSYCGASICTNAGTLQGSASYAGTPGGWNGANTSNLYHTSLQNYEVITANGTNLGDCTADAGDLVFPDGSVWDKSNAKPYSVKLASCDSNDVNAAAIWAAAGGSGSQYAYMRNAPSALSIADAWDGRKNLITGANGTHPYTNTGKNDDYYDRPAVSWYTDTGDGVGTSRLPLLEEYKRGRQGTSASVASLLYGTTNWGQGVWTTEQNPVSSSGALYYMPQYNIDSSDDITANYYRLWVLVKQ